MSTTSRFFLVVLRVSLGCLFLYAGVTKIIAPAWSAAGYLNGAKNFTGFYQWLAQPAMLPITNALNEWGLTLLGISLILGIAVRLSGVLGAVLMILYYLALDFPYPNAHALLVDEHIIYAVALLFLASVRAGRIGGLDHLWGKLPLAARDPRIPSWLG